MSAFHIVSYQNPKLHAKLALWEKNDISKKLLSVIGNKAVKSTGITLHGNKTNFYQELAFKCFWAPYIPKRQNACKTPFMEKQNNITKKHVFWVLPIMLPIKKAKIHAKNPMFGKWRDVTRNVYYEIFFKFVKYEKAKTHK